MTKKHTSWVIAAIAIIAGFVQVLAQSSASFYIHGHIDAARYAPKVSQVLTNTKVRVRFSVQIVGDRWRMNVTNANDAVYWSEIRFDGTNCFLSEPSGGHLWFDQKPDSNQVATTILPGKIYCPDSDDTLALAALWLTYGYSPSLNEKDNFQQYALPWKMCRTVNAATAHGYRWKLGEGSASRFGNDIIFLRDRSLDLNDEAELLRWDSDYPESLQEKHELIESLTTRRNIVDGFVAGRFSSTSRAVTNETSIPISSELIWFFDWSPTSPAYRAKLVATSISTISDAIPIQLENSNHKTLVRDYRYKKERDGRIFKYAEYKLNSGDGWKSDDDPELIAKQEYQLKYGKKHGHFGFWGWYSDISLGVRRILACVVILFPMLGMGLTLIWKKKHKNKT